LRALGPLPQPRKRVAEGRVRATRAGDECSPVDPTHRTVGPHPAAAPPPSPAAAGEGRSRSLWRHSQPLPPPPRSARPWPAAITIAAFGLSTQTLHAAEPVRTFYNVLLPDGADPWVIRHDDGFYYMTVTTGGSIEIIRSRTLSGLGAGEHKVVWRPPASGPT